MGVKMNTALKQNYASVSKFPTKQSQENAFLNFLSNLFIKLEYNDLAFQDLLTNPKSTVVYLEYNRFSGRVPVGAREVKSRLKAFGDTMSYDQINRLYKQFLTKNNISKKVA